MSTFQDYTDETGRVRLRAKTAGIGASRWLGPCKINAFTVQTLYTGQPFVGANGGTLGFTLNAGTVTVAWNGSAADLKAALETLPGITTVTVTLPFGGANITDADTVQVQFEDVEATGFVAVDASVLTGTFAPYADPTPTGGDTTGVTVVEMFTPAVNDIVEDFMHDIVTAFDGVGPSLLTYTDDPTDPNATQPGWSNPSGWMGVTGIDLQRSDTDFTNFSGIGSNDAGVNNAPSIQPTAEAAILSAWVGSAGASVYNNLPARVLNAVPIYSALQGLGDATQGEVWIWVKTATPAPLMD